MDTKFSLWWIPNPDSPAFKLTQEIIDKLAKEYDTSRFDTHITLIADRSGSLEEIINLANKLADQIKPFEVRLGKVRFTDNLYQSLVVVAEGKELENAAYQAGEVWDDFNATVYRPHLSLIYTENKDHDFKKQLVKEVGNELEGMTFLVDQLYIYTSVPGLEGISKWEKVAEIPLK